MPLVCWIPFHLLWKENHTKPGMSIENTCFYIFIRLCLCSSISSDSLISRNTEGDRWNIDLCVCVVIIMLSHYYLICFGNMRYALYNMIKPLLFCKKLSTISGLFCWCSNKWSVVGMDKLVVLFSKLYEESKSNLFKSCTFTKWPTVPRKFWR